VSLGRASCLLTTRSAVTCNDPAADRRCRNRSTCRRTGDRRSALLFGTNRRTKLAPGRASASGTCGSRPGSRHRPRALCPAHNRRRSTRPESGFPGRSALGRIADARPGAVGALLLGHRSNHPSRPPALLLQARPAIFTYIEGWYNPRSRHSTLAYRSPIEFERHHAEHPGLAVKRPKSANGSSPKSSNAPTTRPISTVGIEFVADRSISSPDNPLATPTT
jgi:hypothetical protein